jgi:hypothetical protein
MCTQILGRVLSALNIGNVAPIPGDVGIELSLGYEGNARPSEYLVTAVVTGAPSDLIMYGCVMHGGGVDTPADDLWGLHNNVYGTQLNGKLGTALVVGTHHFVVKDVGVYTRLFFVKSAGNVDIHIRPILYTGRGS